MILEQSLGFLKQHILIITLVVVGIVGFLFFIDTESGVVDIVVVADTHTLVSTTEIPLSVEGVLVAKEDVIAEFNIETG